MALRHLSETESVVRNVHQTGFGQLTDTTFHDVASDNWIFVNESIPLDLTRRIEFRSTDMSYRLNL